MFTRKIGNTDIEVSAMGLGCWAIGGPSTRDGRHVGWGQVDDEESLRAIRKALDMGVTFFDTADVYGCGHSERLVGKALADCRDDVVIATKFGIVFDEATRNITDRNSSPEYIKSACEASLDRLDISVIDLYQLHIAQLEHDVAVTVRDTLEELVAEGKIRCYGWSTDDPENARLFAEGPNCATIQQRMNVFAGNDNTLAVCEDAGLASINRGPLAMGLLTGKFSSDSKLAEDDVRHNWDFTQGEKAEQLAMLEAIRGVLTSDGRTLAQGALGWLWAKSPVTIPIPGFKTVAQVEENCKALELGPLSLEQMQAIEEILAGPDGEQDEDTEK